MSLLSKSAYLLGLQCHKALYLNQHQPGLKTPLSPVDQDRMDEGTAVGRLAHQLFPGGVDIGKQPSKELQDKAAATQQAIANGAHVIYEAAFIHNGVYAAVDILVRDVHGWVIHEVKATTEVKKEHIPDVALQLYVLQGTGLTVVDVRLITLNNTYVRLGELDVNTLFNSTSVLPAVQAEVPAVAQRVADMFSMLAESSPPQKDIGPHCTKPRDCSFMDHCWQHLPDPSVLDLANGRGTQWALYQSGITRLENVPASAKLNSKQQDQVAAQRSGQPIIIKPKLRDFLARLEYPLYHFDFETLRPAVPIYDDSRPYQQIPFQYSLHIQLEKGSEPVPKEFLADGRSDPRPPLILQLLQDIGPRGHIMVYNAQFERDRLSELARDFPQYATPLLAMVDRLVDLEKPFYEHWYYVKEMNGRSSIKAVLPALVPELSYKDLAVQEGGTASLLYTQLATGQYTGDVQQLRKDLLAYCGLDTLAMVKVLGVLLAIAPE